MPTIYEASMNLQTKLDDRSDADKLLIAQLGLDIINRRWDDSVKRMAKAACAYFINDGLTMDSLVQPSLLFGEVVLKGNVPRVACIEVDERIIVALPFFNAKVLDPFLDLEPELVPYELEECSSVLPIDSDLRRPIYTPVENLNYIVYAA